MLSDLVAVELGCRLVHGDLVVAVDIGQPTVGGGEPVHREEPAVRRAERLKVLLEVGPAVDERPGEERDVRRRAHHLGAARDGRVDRGVVLARIDSHRRRV